MYAKAILVTRSPDGLGAQLPTYCFPVIGGMRDILTLLRDL